MHPSVASLRFALRTYADRRILTLLVLGFVSGLPAPLVFSNLSIWLSDEGVSRTAVGLFAFTSTPYALNFLWAPVVDRFPLPWLTGLLGKRRSWLLLMQVMLLLFVLALAQAEPSRSLTSMALLVLMVALSSATQDLVIDAYRVESLEPQRYAAGSAVAVWGWHLGGTLVGGAGGLYLAHLYGWQISYLLLGCTVCAGIVAVLMSAEPEHPADDGAAVASGFGSFHQAAIQPLLEFARRPGAWLILMFIFVFKLGDALLGRMSGVFYRELGIGLDEIATVVKLYGLGANMLGVLVGGVVAARLGILRALFYGGLAAALTNLIYAALALTGPDALMFRVAVMADNFTGGLATVAFVAYLSAQCNLAYTATQYALLASLGNLARIWFSSVSGIMVDSLGGDWAAFFTITSLVALAGLPLLAVIRKRYPLQN